ncbi:MAG: AAA family ATPase [Verrucomicrobia bacterium]|nr:AAA family ATPase [Verrucomicrobiota bacterium]
MGLNHVATTINHLPELLDLFLPQGMSVFLQSKPGLGKTESVTFYAAAANAELHVVVASLHDRLDFTGLPRVTTRPDGASVTDFVPMQLVAHLSREHSPKGRPAVLYFNELNAAPESVLPVLYRLILERKIGNLTLRENVQIIADGNPSSAASAGRDLHQALRRRFVWIVIEESLGVWQDWAVAHQIDGRVLAFLNTHPQLFCDFDPARRERLTYSCPASWTRLSKVLDAILRLQNLDLRVVALAGVIGMEAGAQFAAYLRHSESLPDIEQLLANPENFKTPAKLDELDLVVGCIFNKVAAKHGLRPNAFRIAAKLIKTNREYGVFLGRLLLRHPPLQKGIQTDAGYREFAQAIQEHRGLAELIIASGQEAERLIKGA